MIELSLETGIRLEDLAGLSMEDLSTYLDVIKEREKRASRRR